MARLSIIIPVYYNEKSLHILYSDLKEKVLSIVKDYEIVMVDDGSGDQSWDEMTKLRDIDNNIKLLKLSRNFGSHAAILAGYLNCSGDCAVVKSADLQEPSELIIDMFRCWEKGNKVVLAVREGREEGIIQRACAHIYYWIMRKFVVESMPKSGFDAFLIDRKVIEVLRLLDEKNSAITLQVLWSGFKTKKVYYTRKAREIGKSKWTLAKKIKLVIDSLLGFSYAPIRGISGIGIIICAIAMISAGFLVFNKLVRGVSVEGWTSLMVLVLFAFGTIMFTLGILGEYIWRTLDATRSRPPYIIDEKIESSSYIEQ